MTKSITINRRIPSQNATSNRRGIGAQFAYKKERDAWFALLCSRLIPRGSIPEAKVSIRITSYRNRLLDYGNLVGGAKIIPDCLKRLNYIKDDAPKWFDCDYQQRQVAIADERTVIEWLDVVEAKA